MKHNKHDNVNGWLIIDKPCQIGSTDVVNLTRRLLNANKNGHAGTLDPFASGVLPIAFGEATKLIPFITDGDKEYEFTLSFGTATDTGDCEGRVIHEGGFIPDKEEILQILPTFLGTIVQTPPAYSAIKINGERAYKLARQGKEFEMPQRRVEISSLELIKPCGADSFCFKVQCSKGTYVRTLGQDIALKLGTFGHLTALRRTKCSIFSLNDTILLENLKNLMYVENRQQLLLPIETSLRDIAVIAVSEEDAVKLKQGQSLSPRAYRTEHLLHQTVAAMCHNCLTALVEIEEKRISPIRVFNL